MEEALLDVKCLGNVAKAAEVTDESHDIDDDNYDVVHRQSFHSFPFPMEF